MDSRTTTQQQVVYTNKARCRDCYRCVRVCPVKAIRMHDGQAFVVEERCVSCGTCVRECPQGAKCIRSDLEQTIELARDGAMMAASVAPSFAAVFSEGEQKRLPSALRKLGFKYVGETAVGAFHVARKTADHVRANATKPHILSACPAVVRYVERYRPEFTHALVPIVSPMMAHARHIRERLGENAQVVFIGPCAAKKAEAERPEFRGLVSCVLTFDDLIEWLGRVGISLSKLEESHFDEAPGVDARFFPLEGGISRAAGLDTDVLSNTILTVGGFDELKAALDTAAETGKPVIIDPLFCKQGCINGPGMPDGCSLFQRRGDTLDYATAHPGVRDAGPGGPLETGFTAGAGENDAAIPETEIRRVLEMTGKSREEDQLNCGACGYGTCREKAVAVIRGMAEVEMCLPYMRRLAEQRTDRIIETSPNGIVILDEHLNIISMNPAFRRYFMCSEAVYGKRISYLMDPEQFEKLAASEVDVIEGLVKHEKYGMVCHEILYPLRGEKQFVGIFVNITNSRASQEKLDELRAQTIKQAQELLEHQITMAQKIGQFLGESTARGEQLVEHLRNIASDNPARPERASGKGGQWLNGISTSK